jgi:hypothetical protein
VVETNLAAATETKIEPVLKPRLSKYVRGLVVAAFAIGLSLRLIGLHYPPYDSHNFRQCQTLSTIEDFYRNGINFLHPHTLYMGYPGVFVLELPLFQAIGATLYHCFGPHLEVLRILNIVFGALTTIILYRMSLVWFDRTIAILGALIYWLCPLNVLYQRSTLLDPMAVLCALVSFYSLARLLTEPGNNDSPMRNLNPTQKSAAITIYFWVFAFATLLTALIKALYLWPAVLLIGQCFLARRFKFDRQLLLILVVFAVAGVCFIGWNRYAAQVNSGNLLSEGLRPTSHIGYSALLNVDFYSLMLKTRPKEWLGLLGVLLYVFGLWAWWSERRMAGWRSRLFLIVCVPPTYLLAFAKINYPHNYYQLIITPFLAIVSANGVVWLAKRYQPPAALDYSILKQSVFAVALSVLALAAAANYVVWFKWPRLDSRTVTFERLCAGKVEPWAPAVLFSTARETGMDTYSYVPQFLYAGKLWGYSWVVPNAESAKEKFELVRRGFTRLDYLVFYGTELPKWVASNDFQLIHQDDANRFFVFQSKKDGRSR